MKNFQPYSLYRKHTTLRKKLLLMVTSLFFLNVSGQTLLRIEPGVLLKTDSENLGILLNVEPTVSASENTVIGLRFGIAINPQKVRIDSEAPYFINELDDNGVISFMPTFDYYLNDKRYRPYLGAGLGYYLFNDIDVSDRNGSSDVVQGNVKNQLGLLLRGGLEIGKTRYGLEYNYIPQADIKIPDGQRIGTIDNSYLGVYIGFTIGGRNRL